MKEVFNHTEGTLHSKPRKITRCILIEDIPRAEGIAICNPHDQYSRKRGNQIARGRAYKALEINQLCPLGVIKGLEIKEELVNV